MGCFVAFAQNRKATVKPARTEEQKDNLNKTDAQNRKQGLWFYKREARLGEPLYYEYGNYQNDRKTGLWTKLDAEQSLMATENYTRGVLNGTAQYYERGRLVCIGHYRGLNQDYKYDSVAVTDPITLIDSIVVVPTDIGYTKHGLWRYYDAATGQMTREEEYQVDNLIREKEFHHYSKSDSAAVQQRQEQFPHNKKKAKAEGRYRSQTR